MPIIPYKELFNMKESIIGSLVTKVVFQVPGVISCATPIHCKVLSITVPSCPTFLTRIVSKKSRVKAAVVPAA